jgi:hypothetical protein
MTPADEVVARILHPPRGARRAVGTLYRVCEDALEGMASRRHIDAWWLDQRTSGDQGAAAAVAWEALAARDWIPLSWVGDPARVFLRDPERSPCPACANLPPGCPECPRRHPSETPWTLRECVVFAGDPSGILAVEALAGQWLSRLGRTPRHSAWRTLDSGPATSFRFLTASRWEGPMAREERAILERGYALLDPVEESAALAAALV